jgi:hypothetical protein
MSAVPIVDSDAFTALHTYVPSHRMQGFYMFVRAIQLLQQRIEGVVMVMLS